MSRIVPRSMSEILLIAQWRASATSVRARPSRLRARDGSFEAAEDVLLGLTGGQAGTVRVRALDTGAQQLAMTGDEVILRPAAAPTSSRADSSKQRQTRSRGPSVKLRVMPRTAVLSINVKLHA